MNQEPRVRGWAEWTSPQDQRFICMDCGKDKMTLAEKNNHHLVCADLTSIKITNELLRRVNS